MESILAGMEAFEDMIADIQINSLKEYKDLLKVYLLNADGWVLDNSTHLPKYVDEEIKITIRWYLSKRRYTLSFKNLITDELEVVEFGMIL